MKNANSCRHRLAAFDLDGTLLGPDATISTANHAALQRLHRDGVEVVLASGRHPLNMRSFSQQLPYVRWIVSAQGGEVSDVDRSHRLHNAYLEPAVAHQAVELGLRLGFSPIVYGDDGVRTVANDAGIQYYSSLAGQTPTVSPTAALFRGEIFKVVWIGRNAEHLDSLLGTPEFAALTMVRTHQRIFEIVPPGVTKGSALAVLATHLGITARDAVVFGDGENDIPMFAWAGTSVAMPHGWPAARAQATFVAPPGPPETALARGIEQLLSKHAHHD